MSPAPVEGQSNLVTRLDNQAASVRAALGADERSLEGIVDLDIGTALRDQGPKLDDMTVPLPARAERTDHQTGV